VLAQVFRLFIDSRFGGQDEVYENWQDFLAGFVLLVGRQVQEIASFDLFLHFGLIQVDTEQL
jgi:hypothetical protein